MSTILELGINWKRVIIFKSWPLYHRGKILRYLLDGSMGGPMSRSVLCGIEKNVLLLPEIEPWMSSSKLVAIRTEIFQLLFQVYG